MDPLHRPVEAVPAGAGKEVSREQLLDLLREAEASIRSMATWFRNQPLGCPPAGTAQLQSRLRAALASAPARTMPKDRLRAIAEQHKQRGDDCGALAREVLTALASAPAGAGEGVSAELLRKMAAFPLEDFALADKPDDRELWKAQQWVLTVGDVRKARAILAGEPVAATDEGRKVTATEDRWLRNAVKASGTLVAPGRLVARREPMPRQRLRPINDNDALLIYNLVRASLSGDSLAIDTARMALRQRMNEQPNGDPHER